MTIVTRKRADKFAIIPNAVAEDYRLSFEARGLLCYLLAKPNDWRVEVSDIMQSGGIGRDKAYRLLKELRETGYIELVQKRNAFNHITEHQYVVYDRAVPSEFLLPEKPEVDNPLTENTEVGKPLPENPDAGKPDAGKPDGVLRTKRNQIPKTSPYPQQGGTEGSRFGELKALWPPAHLPNNVEYAARLFDKLSPADQQLAIDHVSVFLRVQRRRKLGFTMIPYLKAKAFREFDGAPTVDLDGDFVILPTNDEWSIWMAEYHRTHGAKGTQYFARIGRMVVKTRWPPGHEHQLSMQIG